MGTAARGSKWRDLAPAAGILLLLAGLVPAALRPEPPAPPDPEFVGLGPVLTRLEDALGAFHDARGRWPTTKEGPDVLAPHLGKPLDVDLAEWVASDGDAGLRWGEDAVNSPAGVPILYENLRDPGRRERGDSVLFTGDRRYARVVADGVAVAIAEGAALAEWEARVRYGRARDTILCLAGVTLAALLAVLAFRAVRSPARRRPLSPGGLFLRAGPLVLALLAAGAGIRSATVTTCGRYVPRYPTWSCPEAVELYVRETKREAAAGLLDAATAAARIRRARDLRARIDDL